jgi:hypothetical protein
MKRNKRENAKRIKKTRIPKEFNRIEVLTNLNTLLEDMATKICRGRIKSQSAQDLKIRSLKAFAYSASVFSSVLDAHENSIVLSRLDAIEATLGGSSTNDTREVEE